MNEEPYKICLRLSTNEAQKLITNAKACGLTRTAYLRRLLNGYDLKPRPSAELEALRTEIHQIGNNINQIARKANLMPDLPAGKKPHERYECWARSMVYCMRLQNSNGGYKDSVPERRLAAGD